MTETESTQPGSGRAGDPRRARRTGVVRAGAIRRRSRRVRAHAPRRGHHRCRGSRRGGRSAVPRRQARGERAEGGRLPAARWGARTRCASSASSGGRGWSLSPTTCSSPTAAVAAGPTRPDVGGGPGRPGRNLSTRRPIYASPDVHVAGVRVARCTRRPVYASPVYASPVYASPDVRVAGLRQSRLRQRRAGDRPATQQRPPGGGAVGEPRLHAMRGGRGCFDRGAGRRPGHRTRDGRLPVRRRRGPAAAAVGHGRRRRPARRRRATRTSIRPPGTARSSRASSSRWRREPPIALQRVLHAEGDGDEVQIAAAIDALPDPPAGGALLSLSFGGYALEEPGLLAAAVARAQDRGYVVVASAGNDATCRPTLPGVAAGRDLRGRRRPARPGPVQQLRPVGAGVCARRRPGEHVLRRLERRRPGRRPTATPTTTRAGRAGAARPSPPPSSSERWPARWPPARPATDAVAKLVDNPALLRLPGLGTVINVL